MPLRFAESALESVPEIEANGRIWISSAACEGNSKFGRTSIGPETEARAFVSPA